MPEHYVTKMKHVEEEKKMYQIIFYVPATHVEQVKNAMFAAGAGNIGAYSHCAWQTLGEG